MHPVDIDVHVQHRIESLTADARAERLAAAHRRAGRNAHLVHPGRDRRHPAAGIRAMLGRALIGLGTVIAGQDARRAA